MALVKGTSRRTGKVETERPDWRPLPQQGRGPVVAAVQPQQPVFQVVQAPPQPQVALLPKQPEVAILPQQAAMPLIVAQPDHLRPEPVPAPVDPRDPRTLDAALRSTWGNLENEGAAGMMKARETGVVPAPVREQNAQVMQNVADHYNMQARLGERDRMRRDREASDRQETRKPLTLEEWNAYSPLQQAAVQANEDLYAAVKRDFATQSQHGKVGEDGRRTNPKLGAYQERVAELFGENGALGYKGLEYAPNTIAFLDSRGIDRAALAGKTLDDLLSGDALMTKDQIDNLGQEVPALDPFKTGQQRTPRESNLAFAQAIAKGQLAYQEELAAKLKAGDALLSGMTSRGTSAEAGESYGAKGLRPMTKLTAVRPETLAQIDKYMEALARPDRDPTESMRVIKLDLEQRGASQEEIDQVYQSMADRVRVAMDGQGDWFPNVEYKLRAPDEVGRILGLTTLKREG